MSYSQSRDDEQLSKLDSAIQDFISRYDSNPSPDDRQTIIFSPGGVGSRLVRATTEYQNGPPLFYNTV